MTEPLVFTHGAAATAFNSVAGAWFAFELVMRLRQQWRADALASDDVYSLVAALVLAGAGLTVRIRAEERQLREALGADYAEFAAHRKRLIPGVL